MKITLPENISEITLNQFQDYVKILEKDLEEYELNKRKIEIFAGVPYEYIDDIDVNDIEDMVAQIDKALNEDVEFIQRFKINDVEFGFHPNLDELKGNEWVDINNYHSDVDNYHRLMAVLFRPIKKIDKYGNYSIVKYKGTSKYAEVMKEMPLNAVNGSLLFFYNLANELEKYTHRSTVEELLKVSKQSNTLKSGGGMLQWFRSLTQLKKV